MQFGFYATKLEWNGIASGADDNLRLVFKQLQEEYGDQALWRYLFRPYGENAAPRRSASTEIVDRNLQFEDGVYWELNNGKKEGPFCQSCWDEHHRRSRLQDGDHYGGGHKWFCVICQNGFGDGASGMMSAWSG